MLKSSILAVCFLLLCYLANAQQGKTITGKVTAGDTKQPLERAVVQEKGTSNNALTDNAGNFSITLLHNNATLTVSYVGYANKDVSVGGSQNLNVELEPSNGNLNEVVVTALGIKREVRTLGYASQQVSADEISQAKQPNLINALQGKIAGVTITSSGGGPGQGASILIRGVNSISPGGNNQPLFVIDG